MRTSSDQFALRNARTPRVSVIGVAMAACLSLPLTAYAQMTMPMPAQQSTPSTKQDAKTSSPSKAAKPKPKARAKSDSARRATSQAAPEPAMDHSKTEGMDHSQMQGMDHSKMEGMDHSQMQDMDHTRMEGMDHGAKPASEGQEMSGMDMGEMNMQGGNAPPGARDPDYSDGISGSHMGGMGMHGESRLGSVVIDQLEAFDGDSATGQSLDAQAWYGSDLDKVWFKADGERSDGRLEDLRTELLWNRAIATYWGVQAGVRHDFGEGPDRTWAAVGVQGLAPYWFEVEATAYVGQSGRTAARVEAEYELLLTQRLILQPDVEANLYGKDDRARGIGSGLSDINVGLRLRYEFTRKFAPYVGISYTRKFGKTADIAREDLGEVDDTQLVAGFRIWF